LSKQCDEQLKVKGVTGELRQMLANLLANSLDAVEENGIVKLRGSVVPSSTGSHCIRMTVADNGRGIGADAMEQIFDSFYTTKGSIGTGLGLWVCKQLVEKNGGSIQVHSSTDGKLRGTTFSVVLPAEVVMAKASKSIGPAV
jgi:signal transduction histidine kinase